MNINEIRWSDGYSTNRLGVVDPDSTDVAPVAEEAREVHKAHAELSAAERERYAARATADRAENASRDAARQAGRSDKKVDAKALRRDVADTREEAAEADLVWDAAVAKMGARRASYLEAVAHQAPALRAEGIAALDAAMLSLASVSSQAQRVEAAMTAALGLLGALEDGGGDFIPRQLVAKRKAFGEGGAPAPYISAARSSMATAMGYAQQILADVREVQKAAVLAAKFEREADEAPDLTDENGAGPLDPDLYDVDGGEDDD